MARPRDDDELDPLNPWGDDDQRDSQALDALLSDDRSDRTPAQQSNTPVSTTMPVDPRTPADLAEHRREGEAAGADMSWMDQPGATTVRPQVQPSVFQGFQPRHRFEGFDWNREQNTGRSAKDAFAYLANQAPPPPTQDKAQLAAWFNQYIRPGMDALGHHVTDVNGDTFRFNNWQGDFTVDYGRGAGAEGGALAWQVDPGTAVQPDNPQYTPQGAGSVSPVAPPMMPLTGGPGGQSGGENPTAMDEILAEIEALMSGQGSPMDARALQGLLQ